MAIDSAQVSVGTTATVLSAVETDGDHAETVTVVNDSGVTVYIGGSGVTTSKGRLPSGRNVTFELRGEALYGIVAAGTATVDVFYQGV